MSPIQSSTEHGLTRRRGGFTLIEIAVSIAIIGFALVAVIGVLPAGMNTQRDNREETMVNQDAQYLIEALTHGIKQNGYLSNVVTRIEWWGTNGPAIPPNGPPFPPGGAPILVFSNNVRSFYNEEAIGLLSVRHGFQTNGATVNSVRAVMRSMNGSATTGWSPTDPTSQDLALWYVVDIHIQPSVTLAQFGRDRGNGVREDKFLEPVQANLHDLRVTFRWPSNPDGTIIGQNRLTFRSVVAGEIFDAGMFGGTQLFSVRSYTLRKP